MGEFMSGNDKRLSTNQAGVLASPETKPAIAGGKAEASKGKAAERDQITPTLAYYFGPTPVPAGAFVKALKAGKVKRFSDEDISAASDLTIQNDPDGLRLLALASLPNRPDVVERWLWGTVQQKLKSSLPDGFDPLDTDLERILRSIQKQLSPLLLSSKKEESTKGETLLCLGLAWLVNKRALDPWSALDELKSIFFESQEDALKASRRALTRGKIGEIRSASAIAALANQTVQDARNREEIERRRQATLQAQLANAQSEIDQLKSMVRNLTQENNDLAQELAASKSEFQQKQQHWGHDMANIKARHRALLKEKVAPLLNDVIDALSIDPPALPVAQRRLEMAKSYIEEGNQ
jgi:hypothetical protein